MDFCNEWFEIPCSNKYWLDVKPIFDMLKKEKKRGTKWTELDDKEDDIYIPLLQAFMGEIRRAYHADKEVPKKMVGYLIGVKDY